MLLNNNFDDETEGRLPDAPTKAWWIGAGICLFPIYLLFSAIGYPGKGTAAICFGGAIVAVVRLRWNLNNRLWFWVTVSLLVLLHAALILFIPWPNENYTLPIVLPAGVIDALMISFVIQLIAKKTGVVDNKMSDQSSAR